MNNASLLAVTVMTAAIIPPIHANDIATINGTTLSVGGYVKVEGTVNRPDRDAAFEAENSFIGQARQSRFFIKTEREVEGHRVKTFLESDFFGNAYEASSTSSYLRMRHAYLQVDNVTLGQTWSGQFFATAPFDVEMINFWGQGMGTLVGNGATVRPQLLAHYTINGLRLSLQDPVYQQASYPDMVVSYSVRFKDGSAFNLAATGRDVQNDKTVDGATDDHSNFGAGVSIAGKLALNTRLSLHASGYRGKGMGAYSGIGVGGAYNPNTIATLEVENETLVAQTGFSAGIRLRLSDNLRTNLRYGNVSVDDAADTEIAMTNVNLIYTYFTGFELGIEWRKQTLDTLNGPEGSSFPNIRPKGKQVEMMALYRF